MKTFSKPFNKMEYVSHNFTNVIILWVLLLNTP